ncbi:MAG: glycosyltransferase, partial [Candidatus Bathyarchaeia archaeon]
KRQACLINSAAYTRGERKKAMSNNAKSSAKLQSQKYLYPLLIAPFILAYLCWQWFPLIAQYIVIHAFGYVPSPQPAHWLWSGALYLFFTLYVFIVIGIGGAFIIAAWIWRRRKKPDRPAYHPTVSFIVPAYNEEKLISRCINSLYETAAAYPGFCQIIVVDDGSTDYTYEIAWAAIQACRRQWPHIHGKVIRHSANLGKAEAIRTGINKATGELIATVDADTWWNPQTLSELVNNMEAHGNAAVSGYIHPSDGKNERRTYIILQQLEYSQGLSILRSAQALLNAIPVVPGPMGLYRATPLRDIVNEKTVKSVAEDLEITLTMQEKHLPIGYTADARSVTDAPTSFKSFWNQRIRWFIGWIHNSLSIHKNLLLQKRWLSLILWHALIIAYIGGILEIATLLSLPLFLWFAPDKIYFLLNLALFLLFALAVGIIYQSIALKFSYGKYNHKHLLLYTPLYYVLNLINTCARMKCLIKYLAGDHGSWNKKPEE